MPAKGSCIAFCSVPSVVGRLGLIFMTEEQHNSGKTGLRTQVSTVRGGWCVWAAACLTPWIGSTASPLPEEVIELPPHTVTAVAEGWLSSGARSDAMGFELAWEQTPRAVTTVPEVRLEREFLAGIADTLRFVPGGQTPRRYGLVVAPNLRGDASESYRNGQRLSANLFGTGAGFNAVESVTLVRGAAPVVFGPGFYNGGYVNYGTKRAFTGEAVTRLQTGIGTVTTRGPSYRDISWQIDHNQPLSEELATRFSYEGRESETLHRRQGARADHQSLYSAWVWKPSLDWVVRADFEYLWEAVPQLPGVNRPTPDLLKEGWYASGKVTDQGGPWVAPWMIEASDPKRLPVDRILLDENDFSNANRAIGQVEVGWWGWDSLSLVNRTLVDHVRRRRHHEFSYSEFVDQRTFENRTEGHLTFERWEMTHRVVAGLTLRLERRESFVNYFNEYLFNFDLTSDRSFSLRDRFPQTYFPGRPGPGGLLFFGAADGSPETTRSWLAQPAVFWQQETQLTRRWTILIGLRLDLFKVRAEDPLPPPGTLPWKDRQREHGRSGHLSLRYSTNRAGTFYATVARTHSLNGSVAGGGLMLFEGAIDRSDLNNRSLLYETGWRMDVEGRLQVGLTAYQQDRIRMEFRGGRSDLRVRGLEAEVAALLGPDTRVFVNAAFTDGRYLDSAPFELGGQFWEAFYGAGAGPSGFGTGEGFEPFPGARQVPRGDYRLPGLSRWYGQAGFSWTPSRGAGFRLWGEWGSSQVANLAATLRIPSQFTLNAAIHWNWMHWGWVLEVLNLTDQDNWLHNGDTFMNNQLVSREWPRRLQLRLHYRF